jgi:hypothetical protein
MRMMVEEMDEIWIKKGIEIVSGLERDENERVRDEATVVMKILMKKKTNIKSVTPDTPDTTELTPPSCPPTIPTLTTQTGREIRTTLFQPQWLTQTEDKVECTTAPGKGNYASFAIDHVISSVSSFPFLFSICHSSEHLHN